VQLLALLNENYLVTIFHGLQCSVVSPEMTCKTGQISVRPWGVKHFRNPKAPTPLQGRGRWNSADIMGLGLWDKTSTKRNFEFPAHAPCGATLTLARSAETTHPDQGVYFNCFSTRGVVRVAWDLTPSDPLPDSFRQPQQSCLDTPPHPLVNPSLSSSPLSSSITPSLFHSRLKTYLFNKSFPP